MPLKKLSSLEKEHLQGKKVLLRVDFNVPLKEGKVMDATRIKKTLPTINYLLKNGSSVIIMTHIGRPKGRFVDDLSTAPIATELSKMINRPVIEANDCIGAEVSKLKQELKQGEILMLENTRFHTAEKENTRDFSRELAEHCDLFIQDAFASVHRGHASTVGVAHFLPSYAGLLVEREAEVLSEITKNDEHPFVLVTGGAKIDTKIGVIRHFLKTADSILVGGGLANTFLYASGFEVGASLCEKNKTDLAQEILADSESMGGKLHIPIDTIVAKEISSNADFNNKQNDLIMEDDIMLDIGVVTQDYFLECIKNAKVIVWNGPMGLFEHDIFAQGTKRIARAIADSDAMTVIGGGDTIEAINRFNISEDSFTHVSTGGGAMIEFLEGKILPGLSVLKD